MNSSVTPAVDDAESDARPDGLPAERRGPRPHDDQEQHARPEQAQPGRAAGADLVDQADDAASPSWTQSIDATAIEAPVRAEERAMRVVNRAQERSRPRDFAGHIVHEINTMRQWTSADSRCCSSSPGSGSMHEVAAELGTTTSSVSQGIAALARDVGTPLVEPDGRRVRLTPAGHRLAEHAVAILAAVDAARLDLDPTAEPAGVLRVAGFATAIRRSLLPAIDDLAPDPPRHRGARPRARAVGGPRPARARRRRPRPDLRLRPRAGLVAQRARRHAAVGDRSGDSGCRRPNRRRPLGDVRRS